MNAELLTPVVLVTGASRGIGRAVALAFGECGYRVAVHYKENRQGAQTTAKELERLGAQTLLVKGDVSNPRDVSRVFESLDQKWGQLDVLIANAGTSRDQLISKTTQEDWEEVIGVNLSGTFYCMKEAAALMSRQQSGCILNIGSFLGFQGAYGAANYAASKSALVGLTKSAAREFGRFKVCVNLVLPGFHITDLIKKLSPRVIDRAKENSVLGELPPLDLVSRFIVTLSEQRYISGQVFSLDSRIL